jgi:hypothetical protein
MERDCAGFEACRRVAVMAKGRRRMKAMVALSRKLCCEFVDDGGEYEEETAGRMTCRRRKL